MWLSIYKSPYLVEKFTESGPGEAGSSDEHVSKLILGMLLGKDWELAEYEDGRILLRQRPPHDNWTWEFFRIDA